MTSSTQHVKSACLYHLDSFLGQRVLKELLELPIGLTQLHQSIIAGSLGKWGFSGKGGHKFLKLQKRPHLLCDFAGGYFCNSIRQRPLEVFRHLCWIELFVHRRHLGELGELEESFCKPATQVQHRHLRDVTAQDDICPSTSHVRGDSHLAKPASLRDGLVLSGDRLGTRVQQLRLNAILFQLRHDPFRHLDVGSTNQNWTPVTLIVEHDFLDNGVDLGILSLVNHIRVVTTNHWPSRRNSRAPQPVDLPELRRFCQRRAGHGAEPREEPKKGLVGNLRSHL
mmetsp:Transcript_8203/g.12993  ORF Transcript_8203/g.12993 Transcript_8203/m.12993 type:complete len:282 (-) Transcript_8203:1197-2042(-)